MRRSSRRVWGQVRLIIVDDDPLIRQGLRMIVEALGTEVLSEAEDGRAGIEQANLHHPELILLDVSMPVMGGFAAAQQLKFNMPEMRIIFITHHKEPAYVEEAWRMGGNGYVLKQTAAADLGDAIQAVMSGKQFLSPQLAA